uniref:MHD domain-containing protein n=1 Tax=Solanum lycopersicum TaxID=4081 RepID=K4DG78_SOLLC
MLCVVCGLIVQRSLAVVPILEIEWYRITDGVNLPFRVLPTIKELGRTRMEVNVKVKSVFGAKMFALGVVIKIPVPKQTAKTNFQVTSGRAKYNAAIDCLVWKRVIYCLITIGVFLEDVVKDSGTFLVFFCLLVYLDSTIRV